jgi:peptidoglycan/LPS O-acetylase OafA/YrhL
MSNCAAGNSKSTPRFPALDGIRGICAVGLVIQHLLLTWPDPIVRQLHMAVYYTPLEALFSDGKFIRIFFVMSGFVLFLPLLAGGRDNWHHFYVRRMRRLFPAFLAAIVLSAVIHIALPQPLYLASATPWFNEEAQQTRVSLLSFLQTLTLMGTSDSIRLDCVVWSLVHEVRIILLFPLLAWLIRRNDLWSLAGSFAVSLIASAIYTAIGEKGFFTTAETLVGTVCVTLHYLPLFVTGMVMAKRFDALASAMDGLQPLAKLALWVLAFVLVRRQQEYIAGPASALLILLCLRSGYAGRLLCARPLEWLGKISYSLYLLHIPMLILVVHVFNGVLPLGANLLIAFAVALAVSHVFDRTIVRRKVRSTPWRKPTTGAAVPA